MNTIDYLHLVFPILLICLVFIPIQYIKWVLPTPSIIYLTWIICNGCPLTRHTETGQHGFICNMLQKIDPDITPQKTNNIIGFCMTFILAILSYRVIGYYHLRRG